MVDELTSARDRLRRYATAVPRPPAVLRILSSRRSFFARRSLVALTLLLSLLALPAVAQAVEEQATINFDDLPTLTRVTNQYEATKAILFASPFEYGFEDSEPSNGGADGAAFCGAPYTREESLTSSLPNEAVFTCGGGEFPVAGTFAVLTNFARKVSAKVGDPGLPGSNTFRLDAYNVQKELIRSAEATSLTQEVNTPISVEVEGGAYEIAYFALYRCLPPNDESFVVGMDDIELTTDSAQAPSISIASSVGGRLPQGTKSEHQVSIVRHNHSEGPVELKAEGLPSGVTASFNPAILTGTEKKSTLTLTVAENAPTAETTGVLEAVPKVVKAGKAPSTVPVTLAVVAPFNVYVGLASSIPASTSVTALPCSTTAVGVRTTIEAPFSEPCGPCPLDRRRNPRRQLDHARKERARTVGFQPQRGERTDAAHHAQRQWRLGRLLLCLHPGYQRFVLRAAATVEVQRRTDVNSISTTSGRTPQSLQPGTPVRLTAAASARAAPSSSATPTPWRPRTRSTSTAPS